MRNCVFCRITENEEPADRLFEDDDVLAFLDIAPINPGHTLVIPKTHHTSVTSVPPELLQRIFHTACKLAPAIMREVDADGFNLHLANGQCAGQAVPHTHVHVIPRSADDGFAWNWRAIAGEAPAARRKLAVDVRTRLQKKGELQARE